MVRCETACSPSWSIPMCRRTTTAVSGSCGQQPRIARSRAGSAQTGVPICSPPFALLSEQRRGTDAMRIRRSVLSWMGKPSFNRVEQLPETRPLCCLMQDNEGRTSMNTPNSPEIGEATLQEWFCEALDDLPLPNDVAELFLLT